MLQVAEQEVGRQLKACAATNAALWTSLDDKRGKQVPMIFTGLVATSVAAQADASKQPLQSAPQTVSAVLSVAN